jgi:hypothetical protein
MLVGLDVAGAGQRLIPETIPLRFFGTAAVAHVGLWLAVFALADRLPEFTGGLSPELAVAHTLTLGVLVMTAMGASLQMLPVGLGRSAPSSAACNAVYGLFVTALALLLVGFAWIADRLIVAGALLASVAVTVYGITVARIIFRSTEMRVVVLHVWVALASLALLVGLAVAMALDYRGGFLADHMRTAVVHAVLGGYGFMGMLALGLSQVVVPLFAVSLVPYAEWVEASFWYSSAGLCFAVLGTGFGEPLVVLVALVAGLAAVFFHLRLMIDTVKRRLRRRLSPEFVLLKVSWAFLPVSLLLGAALAFDLLPATGPALFGFVLLFGWLLTLLVGVLQRIVPFLASMHTGRPGRRPAAPSELTDERMLVVSRWSHLSAVAVVALGIAVDAGLLVRVGAAAGVVGAVAFLLFMATVWRRTRAHLKASGTAAGKASHPSRAA